MQPPVKAEITVKVLSDGGFTVQGVEMGFNPASNQADVVEQTLRARELSSDVLDDVKTFLAKYSTFAVIS